MSKKRPTADDRDKIELMRSLPNGSYTLVIEDAPIGSAPLRAEGGATFRDGSRRYIFIPK